MNRWLTFPRAARDTVLALALVVIASSLVAKHLWAQASAPTAPGRTEAVWIALIGTVVPMLTLLVGYVQWRHGRVLQTIHARTEETGRVVNGRYDSLVKEVAEMKNAAVAINTAMLLADATKRVGVLQAEVAALQRRRTERPKGRPR